MANGFGLYSDRGVCHLAGNYSIGKALMVQRDCYRISGRSDGVPILFLHGFMGDRHDFSDVIERLSNRFCCLSLDLPGHGQNIGLDNSQYRLTETAKSVIDLLDQLCIQQCFLVGYSMGGRLALYLTVHFPDRFLKVVLESASPGLKTEAERQERVRRDRQLAARLETEDFAEFLESWYAQPLWRSTKLDLQTLRNRRLQNQPLELSKSLRGMGTGVQPSLWQELAQMRVPLFLVVGQWDEKFVGINQEMRSICQMAQLTVMPECGHNVHWEQPQAFGKRLRSFLLDRLGDLPEVLRLWKPTFFF
jgi:2-succinyl-6-hydroxy-2,4-cyclohexadiene-1-carboxylate synthase